jgi:Icc-related predicted phosphoesterase
MAAEKLCILRPMRLQLMSDLHFEFHRDGGRAFVDSLDPNGIDVLVLAGDIAVAEGIQPALKLLCGRFRDASVVYVHGNHEFYDGERSFVVALTRRAQAENPNLTWLDCSRTELHGFQFLGAPLWFPLSTVDEGLKHAMNDFSAIEDFESWVYRENAKAIAFFERELRPGDIVVTHHLPSQRCVAPRFAGHALNRFFVCDLTGLMIERKPRLWLHGHSHASVRAQIGETTVLCNPFGYAVEELNPEFLDRLVVDL